MSNDMGRMIGDRFVPLAEMDKGQLQDTIQQAQIAGHKRLEQAAKDQLEAIK